MSEPVETSVTVQAPVPVVMEIVTDLENTERWANEARSAEVDERDDQGRPARITVTLGAIGFTTTATYAVSCTDTSVTLTLVEGGTIISDSTITYLAHDVGGGTTRLEMSSTMEVTVPVPRWGLEKAMRASADKNLDAIRRDAEAAEAA